MIFSSRVHIFKIHIIINVAAAAVAHTRNKYTSYVCTECIGCEMFKLLLPQKIWSGVQCLQNWCGCRIKTVPPLLPPKNYCIYISMCGAIARYDVRAIHTDHIEAQSWQHHAFAKLVINENWKFSFKIIIFHHRLSKQNEKKNRKRTWDSFLVQPNINIDGISQNVSIRNFITELLSEKTENYAQRKMAAHCTRRAQDLRS